MIGTKKSPHTRRSTRRSSRQSTRRSSRRSTRRSSTRRSSTRQTNEAKKMALRAATQLPPYVNDMKVSSGVMACNLGPSGMVCNRNMGYEVDCHRVSENKVICYVNGLKFICERKKASAPMKCKLSRS